MKKHERLSVIKTDRVIEPGYIYCFNAVGTQKFKIGKTGDVKSRLNAIQTASPLKIRYVYHAYVLDTQRMEIELHRLFADKRLIGEWFELTTQEVKEIILLMKLVWEKEPDEVIEYLKVETFVSENKDIFEKPEVLEVEVEEIPQQFFVPEKPVVPSIVVEWTADKVVEFYPNYTAESLFGEIAAALKTGAKVRDVITNILKCKGGRTHKTRSYTVHGKTLMIWLLTTYGDESLLQLPKVKKFLEEELGAK